MNGAKKETAFSKDVGQVGQGADLRPEVCQAGHPPHHQRADPLGELSRKLPILPPAGQVGRSQQPRARAVPGSGEQGYVGVTGGAGAGSRLRAGHLLSYNNKL